MRHRTTSALAALGLVLFAGCSTEDPPPASPSAPAPAASVSASDAAEPAYDPCAGLDAKKISKILQAEVRIDSSATTADTHCSLVPASDGDATFQINYSAYSGTLDDALGTLGDLARTIEIPGATAARLVFRTYQGRQGLSATGFVQNGELVQLVNVVDIPPYHPDQVKAATIEVLTELSTQASSYAASAPPA